MDGKSVYAFLADPANRVVNNDLYNLAKDWARRAQSLDTTPTQHETEELAAACTAVLATVPYMYKDSDELDEEFL